MLLMVSVPTVHAEGRSISVRNTVKIKCQSCKHVRCELLVRTLSEQTARRNRKGSSKQRQRKFQEEGDLNEVRLSSDAVAVRMIDNEIKREQDETGGILNGEDVNSYLTTAK